MPYVADTPFNNDASSQLDFPVVVRALQEWLVANPTLSDYFASSFTAPINQQVTNSVLITLPPTVDFEDTPATRDGLLPFTGITGGGNVECTLKIDKHSKVPVDPMGVLPSVAATQMAAAIGKGLRTLSNNEFAAELVAGSSELVSFGAFSGSTTGAAVWSAFVDAITYFQEQEIDTTSLNLIVKPAVWNKLVKDDKVLGLSIDAKGRAAELLGVANVIVSSLPVVDVSGTNKATLFVLAHSNSAAQAKRLTALKQYEQDEIQVLFSRVKAGTTVVVPEAVYVAHVA